MDEVEVGGAKGKLCINHGEDTVEGMQCSEHPYRNTPAGGVCAFCLQDKLGKLVGSSSSSPSFISSDHIAAAATADATTAATTNTSFSLAIHATSGKVGNDCGHNNHFQEHSHGKCRIPFLLTKKKKKMMFASSIASSAPTATSNSCHFFDTRSSTRGRYQESNPRGRGRFWSFLYYLSSSSSSSKPYAATHTKGIDKDVVVEDDNSSSIPRKVSRSRSIGCGSRSFSGDFFERISTGFGDCTLRRVESQREGKSKSSKSNIKGRVRCGGIFGGLITITPSSSSSTSSSSYWASSSKEVGKTMAGPLAHGRPRTWGWAFASPGKPAGPRDGRR